MDENILPSAPEISNNDEYVSQPEGIPSSFNIDRTDVTQSTPMNINGIYLYIYIFIVRFDIKGI